MKRNQSVKLDYYSDGGDYDYDCASHYHQTKSTNQHVKEK